MSHQAQVGVGTENRPKSLLFKSQNPTKYEFNHQDLSEFYPMSVPVQPVEPLPLLGTLVRRVVAWPWRSACGPARNSTE